VCLLFRYESGVRYLAAQQKYRKMALQAAEEQGLLEEVKKMNKKRKKEEVKAKEEKIIKTVLEDKMDIRGGYAKPKISDVLWVRLIVFPYTFYIYAAWYIAWIWRFNIKKEEYGEEEKLYLIRRYLGISETQFEVKLTNICITYSLLTKFISQGIEERDKAEFLCEKLWIKENFNVRDLKLIYQTIAALNYWEIETIEYVSYLMFFHFIVFFFVEFVV